uniref:Uncharacterized protein AlNc14C47G3804 n=1 Tax=Albugo laibachii Nc14 TaxID=890382 RepID=F0WAU2_9STRA|nr:conserved hypothetical protein [Albugo laibachii Nc14]|eukprot:CCA18264.1 conserved hypothetical protein [Albugo laibachii Nc14]
MAPLVIIRQGGKQIEYRNDCFKNQSYMERQLKESGYLRLSDHKEILGKSSNQGKKSREERIATNDHSIRDNQDEQGSPNDIPDVNEEFHPCREEFSRIDDDYSGESSEDDEDANQIPFEVNQTKQQLYSSSPPHIRHIYAEVHLSECMRPFRCAMCASVVADRDDVISKTFFGQTGKAYLMNNMHNFCMGSSRNRYLMTGLHTICDVHCSCCSALLGWKYLKAREPSQRYKEGKFIMERAVVDEPQEELKAL